MRTCHGTSINPLGFATESFDALGRFRSVQALFDASGNQTGTRELKRDRHAAGGVRGRDDHLVSG